MILAMAISPSVPILAISFAYWWGTGSTAWFAIFFLFGYLFFIVIGIPVAAILVLQQKRQLLACVIAGGVVTVAPLLLLTMLSMSASVFNFTAETRGNYALLFLSGCLGGGLFWLIALGKLDVKWSIRGAKGRG